MFDQSRTFSPRCWEQLDAFYNSTHRAVPGPRRNIIQLLASQTLNICILHVHYTIDKVPKCACVESTHCLAICSLSKCDKNST